MSQNNYDIIRNSNKLIGEFLIENTKDEDKPYVHIVLKNGRHKLRDELEFDSETIIAFLGNAKKFEIKIIEYRKDDE